MGDLDPLGLPGAGVSVSLSSLIDKHFIHHPGAVYLLILSSEVRFPFAVTNVNFPPFSS